MLRAVEAAHTARRSRWEHLRHHPTGASCRWRVKTSCNKNCAAVALRPTYVQQQFQAVHAIPSCMRPYMGGLAKCVRRLGLRRSHDTSGRSPQPSRRHAVAYYCTHHRRKSAVRTNCVPYGGEWLPEAWLHAAHRSGAGGQPGTHRGCHHCRGGRVQGSVARVALLRRDPMRRRCHLRGAPAVLAGRTSSMHDPPSYLGAFATLGCEYISADACSTAGGPFPAISRTTSAAPLGMHASMHHAHKESPAGHDPHVGPRLTGRHAETSTAAGGALGQRVRAEWQHHAWTAGAAARHTCDRGGLGSEGPRGAAHGELDEMEGAALRAEGEGSVRRA